MPSWSEEDLTVSLRVFIKAQSRSRFGQVSSVWAAGMDDPLRIWREQTSRIYLLLAGLVMPGGVGGRELAVQRRAQQPRLKVIFTSGYGPDLAGRELTLEPGQGFLQKTCPPQRLLKTVRPCLDS